MSKQKRIKWRMVYQARDDYVTVRWEPADKAGRYNIEITPWHKGWRLEGHATIEDGGAVYGAAQAVVTAGPYAGKQVLWRGSYQWRPNSIRWASNGLDEEPELRSLLDRAIEYMVATIRDPWQLDRSMVMVPA
jgi:hypothetical protein